jgi:hypothetical protein
MRRHPIRSHCTPRQAERTPLWGAINMPITRPIAITLTAATRRSILLSGYLKCGIFLLLLGTLIATGCAAYYTRQQWRTANDTEIRQLRAYLIVSGKTLTNVAFDQKVHVDGMFDNMGQTPVYDATWISGINILPYPLTGEIPNPECAKIVELPGVQKWFFGKQTYPTKDRETPVTIEEINQINSRSFAIYFHGRVCYYDIFKKLRRTDFCVLWREEGKGFGPATYCENGNEAD